MTFDTSRPPRRITPTLIGLALLGGIALATPGAARAGPAVVYSTGFENPPFAPGSQLLGQDGWSTAIPPFLNPTAPIISTDSPANGSQAVLVRGSDLATAAEVAPFTAVGSYRRPVDYDTAASGLPVVRVQSKVRLDGPLTQNTDAAEANVAAISPDGTVGEIGISSDGVVNAFASSTGPADDAPTFSTPVSLGQYHELAVVVDFANNNYRFLVDGQTPQGWTALPFESGFTSDVLARGSVVVYNRLDAAGRAAYAYRYDDFSITASPTAVPLPTGLQLGGVGALCLLAALYRCRNRAAE